MSTASSHTAAVATITVAWQLHILYWRLSQPKRGHPTHLLDHEEAPCFVRPNLLVGTES